MIIPYTNTEGGVAKMSFSSRAFTLMDVLTSTSNKVFKNCKEQGLCPFMESPCEKEIFNKHSHKYVVFKFPGRMGFIPGNDAKMLLLKLYLMIKSLIHKVQLKGNC
jgi:hypothetical protein